MTISQSAVANWLPRRFLMRSADTDREQFEEAYGDTLFLLVRLKSYTDPLSVGLAATCPLDSADAVSSQFAAAFAAAGSTVETSVSRSVHAQMVQDWIATPMAQEPRFVVPLRKRLSDGSKRITLGRSYQCDIVFREESVSKSHAYFEFDQNRMLWLVDEGSKNRTRINGELLEGRRTVHPGDVLRFGKVEAMACTAGALWSRIIGEA